MNDLFPYGYDVNVYIDKAMEIMKKTYPWATKDMLRKKQSYAIEESNGEHKYVSYFEWSKKDIERNVLDCNGKTFIDTIISNNKYSIENSNPVIERFKVDWKGRIELSGDWNLEGYKFRKHKLGGYSAWVQGGNRYTGGSRTFFIPPDYFNGSYDEFLDKYVKLVPFYFGLGKKDLEKIPELKKFLGF